MASGNRRIFPIRVTFVAAILFIICFPGFLMAWNHTEIKWKKIETEHFSIHFHEGEEWSARETARIAEEIYGPITEFYGYPIDRVHITLYDRNDRPSGAAFYYLNRIDIDASDYEFHFRGTADWLRNLITHEFTHMVTIRTAMKLPRIMPAIYLQGITFEKEKRPDVITGYPNFQGSLPVAGEVLPNWFAEGVAQFQCPSSRNDIWDSHRDMLLRTAVLNGRLLTLDEMGVFGKNSLESELVYNQGYSLVRFINDRFGRESLCRLLNAHKAYYRVGFEGACRKALGLSGNELYLMWVEHLRGEYEKTYRMISDNIRAGERAGGDGYMNLFPVQGEGAVYYLSNMGGDYIDLDLVKQAGEENPEVMSEGVESRAALSNDSGFLCYSKRTGDNDYGYELNDVFIMDALTLKEKRLTRSLRAVDPVFSPDGLTIACIRVTDGAEDVVAVDIASGEVSNVVRGEKGRRYFGLSWGEDGILTSKFDGTSRNIVLIDPETGGEKELVATSADERDPRWDGNGGFFYSSDRTGIFNIYRRDIGTTEDVMVTNVEGGAFSPDVSGDDLLFSSYGPDGYEIRRISGWREGTLVAGSIPDDKLMMESRKMVFSRGEAEIGSGADYDYSTLDSKMRDAGRFDIEYTPVFVFPRLIYYDKKPRIGLVLDSRDYLDRQAVFAAGSMNIDKEFNLQFGFETRQFLPTFSFDFLSARKYYRYFEEETGEVQIRYDLWDAYFTCKFEIGRPSRNRRRDLSLRYNHGEYGLNVNAWEAQTYESGWNYYKANEVSVLFDYIKTERAVDSDINPGSGRRIDVEITRAWNKLHEGTFEYVFKPNYANNDFGRYYLRYEEFIPIPFGSHTLTLLAQGGLLDETNIDDFFDLYLGGRDGMRGYSYYSMGGKKNAMARVTYRFPILRRINRQVLSTYFGSLYGALFIEAGKAWDSNELNLNGNRKDAGFEMRLKGFSFYNYPLAASLEAAYGFDEIVFRDPFRAGVTSVEGREWKFYGTVFFDF